jgi:hypothetical protein
MARILKSPAVGSSGDLTTAQRVQGDDASMVGQSFVVFCAAMTWTRRRIFIQKFTGNLRTQEVIFMAGAMRGRAIVKFVIWTVLSVALFAYAWSTYRSGQMVTWYYYKASTDGYAVNDSTFKGATKEKPAILQIGAFQKIEGLQAVLVKKGDRLPENADGIISNKILKEGKRAKLEGNTLKVMVPAQIEEKGGFKYRDTFKHKGVQTNPWSGVWNVAVVLLLGFFLGMMAEGFTDMMGFKLKKIQHFEGAH